jgi:hypothetical protein
MNVKLNIEKQRRQFSAHVVTLLVLVVVVLVLGGPSIQAQTRTTDPATTVTDTPVVDSSLTISTKGTVNDPSGAITVSGSVIITARRVIDNTSVGSPIVVLDIDFSNLKGTSGSLKTLTTYVTGENHATELRPLQATDTIIVTCPYFDSSKDALSARSMLVTATLNFDISSGKLASGSISIGNNVITSKEVGTFTAR